MPVAAMATVRIAPTTIGGANANANCRAAFDHSGRPADFAFRWMANTQRAIATAASISQSASRPAADLLVEPSQAAMHGVIPIAIPPRPGTAVNDDARSMVW